MHVQEAGRVDTGRGHRGDLLDLERELRSKDHAVAALLSYVMSVNTSTNPPCTTVQDATACGERGVVAVHAGQMLTTDKILTATFASASGGHSAAQRYELPLRGEPIDKGPRKIMTTSAPEHPTGSAGPAATSASTAAAKRPSRPSRPLN